MSFSSLLRRLASGRRSRAQHQPQRRRAAIVAAEHVRVGVRRLDAHRPQHLDLLGELRDRVVVGDRGGHFLNRLRQEAVLLAQPSMTVPAIGTAVADLTELALNGTEFAITVAEKRGTDWAFSSMKFSRCLITSANPSNVVIDGAPAASFNCLALVANLEA